jgi:hypothetical protein
MIGSIPTIGHQNSVAPNKKITLMMSISHMWSMAKLRSDVRKNTNMAP